MCILYLYKIVSLVYIAIIGDCSSQPPQFTPFTDDISILKEFNIFFTLSPTHVHPYPQ